MKQGEMPVVVEAVNLKFRNFPYIALLYIFIMTIIRTFIELDELHDSFYVYFL